MSDTIFVYFWICFHVMLGNRSGHGVTASGIVIEGHLLSKLKSNPTVRAWGGDCSRSVAEADICKAIEKSQTAR